MHVSMIGPRRLSPTPLAGLDFYVTHLAEYLTNQNYQVTVYTHAYWQPKPDSNPLYPFQVEAVWSPPRHHLDTLIYSFLATLKALSQRSDIFHYHGGAALFSWIPRLLRKKVIYTVHSMEWQSKTVSSLASLFFRLSEWVGIRTAHECVTVSKFLQHHLAKRHHKKIERVPCGIKKRSCGTEEEIKKLGLHPRSYFLFLGRLAKGKGIENLIEAFQTSGLSKKGLTLVVAGDSLYSSDLAEKRIQNPNENILFLGRVDGILKEELLANALLYCQASKSEGLSIALLEAMSYGLPVLVSNIEPNREVVGKNGLFFQTGDVGDLKCKMIQAVDNKEALFKMGQRAQAEAVTHYSPEISGKKMMALYQRFPS